MVVEIVDHLLHLVMDIVEIGLGGVGSADIHPRNFGLHDDS